ncbi:inverse autotransporter beta domain-containing protein [Legionella jamestowniensis]|nr:inverse autotransporter beta domain-containing protein [Legionella jamestowniensis]
MSSPAAATSENFPLPARLFGDGTAGTTAGTRGDLMLPLFGNERGMVYSDVQGKYYRDNSWFGGIAGGFRQLFGSYLLGGFLFVDRSESSHGTHFWSLNPGIEGMGPQWDTHLNGYFPVNNSSKTFNRVWAEELGDYRFVNFSEHKQFDHILVDTETAGRGVDAEIGYRVPQLNNLRLALGGYYFNFQDINDMRGIIGTVEYPFNDRVSVLAQDSYDNLHNNTFLITVRLRFGAINPQEGHMLEPIRRNLGTLDSGTSIPTERAWVDTGPNFVKKDHIWFFKPGGEVFNASNGLGNCTAERPCTNIDFTQEEIDSINALDAGSSLYLASGDYLLGGLSGSGTISLNTGQSLEGRSSNFVTPAADGEVRLLGGMIMNGSSLLANVTLHPLNSSLATFEQDKPFPQFFFSHNIGVEMNGSSNLLENTRVGTLGDLNGYHTGVVVNNSRYTLIIGSQINAGATNETARGIVANNAFLEIRNSNIQVRGLGNDRQGQFNIIAQGIVMRGQSELFADKTNINVRADSTTAPRTIAEGIIANDLSVINVIRSAFLINATQNRPFSDAIATAIVNNTFIPAGLNFQKTSHVIENRISVFAGTTVTGDARAVGINDSKINTIPLIAEDNRFFLLTFDRRNA